MELADIELWFKENKDRGDPEITRDIDFTTKVFDNLLEFINREIVQPLFLGETMAAVLNKKMDKMEAFLNIHKQGERDLGKHRMLTYSMFGMMFDYLREVDDIRRKMVA